MVGADMEDLAVRLVPGKGRGVFAERDFEADEVIERCPVALIDHEHYPQYLATLLADYGFQFGNVAAIPLGYGCIYNHSPEPNCRFVPHLTEHRIDFVAVKPITAGEEITHHYGWRRSRVPSWYEDHWGLTRPLLRLRVPTGVAVAAVWAVAVLAVVGVTRSLVVVAKRVRRITRRGQSGTR